LARLPPGAHWKVFLFKTNLLIYFLALETMNSRQPPGLRRELPPIHRFLARLPSGHQFEHKKAPIAGGSLESFFNQN
jgi:hypothetical protein